MAYVIPHNKMYLFFTNILIKPNHSMSQLMVICYTIFHNNAYFILTFKYEFHYIDGQ